MVTMKDHSEIEQCAKEESKQWPQILAVFSGTLLAICCGFHMSWPSPSVLKLLANDLNFTITEDEVSYIVMVAPLGYVIGSPVSGYLLDKIGRKGSLLLLSIPQIIGWILIATSVNVEMLYVARILTGIADGALFTCLPVYICEILEPKIRGRLGTSHSIGIVIGMLLINCYGSYVSIRTAAYISLSVPILFLLTFVWMPESPYYYLIKKRTNEARRALQRFRRMNNVEFELNKITADVQRQISEPKSIRNIFTIQTNLKAFLILLCLRTLQQVSGITALGFYVQVVFKQADAGLSPSESAIICCAIQVLVITFGSTLVDRFGRRPLIMSSVTGTATVLIILGLYFYFQEYNYDLSAFTWLPITGMMFYNVLSAIGILMVPNLMTGELLSASVKSKALGLLNVYVGLSMSASSKLFQWLESDYGMYMPFFVFGACCIVGSVFCYICVPETKGKSLEEIQQTLRGNHKDANDDTGIKINDMKKV